MNDHNEYRENSTEQSSRSGPEVATFLGWAGSMTLAISAISFMLQGLEDFDPGYRNWVISGFVVVLCICGLICGYLMKETLGARLFFGLATAILTVQFTQIGTMIHQYLGPVSDDLHSALSWWRVDRIPLSMFALIVVASLILTTLVVPAGFSMLARTEARKLSLGFLIGNALLLVPSRDNFVMAMACITLFAGLRVLTRRSLTEAPVLRTAEGFAALAIMWIPLAIIGSRGFFYPDNWVMLSAILGIVAMTLFIDVRLFVKSPFIRFLVQILGASSALVAWLIVAQETLYRYPFLYGVETLWILLPLALLLHLLSYSAEDQASKYRAGAGLLAGFTTLGFLLDHPGYAASFLCISTGIALTCSGINKKEKIPFLSGMVSFVAGILFNLNFALDFYQAFPWASSTVLGLLVLLLASYINSRERIFLQKTWKAYQVLKSRS
ncbi:MAG: hypothetical protein ACRERU_20155 [Methylococcales bacterium]